MLTEQDVRAAIASTVDTVDAAHLPNVELVPLPGHASHAVVTRLVTDGTFQHHLRWVAEPAAAAETHAMETLSRVRERAG